jgi:hypothetical protein
MIRITSKRHLFRRAGMAHPKGLMEYPDDGFSEDQLKALKAEAMLTVEEIREPESDDQVGADSSAEPASAGAPAGKKARKK